jgi:predicted ATPase
MLKRISTSKHGLYELIASGARLPTKGNLVTVIVGKNGTGKSRLLRSVVSFFLDSKIDFEKKSLSRTEKLTLDAIPEFDTFPSRIICVSMNPFDKFPLIRRNVRSDFYSYLGLRQLGTVDLGLAYMSRIMSTLIDAICAERGQAESVANTLRYLGYAPEIHATFNSIPSSIIEELVSKGPHEMLNRGTKNSMINLARMEFLTTLWGFLQKAPENEQLLHSVLKKRSRLRGGNRSQQTLIISSRGLMSADAHIDGNDENLHDLIILISSGVLRLKDIRLWKSKKNSGSVIKLSEASSGEQTVLMSLLGIASQIQDGALICIDEPEVCLHPEWQERYIELLHNTFARYDGCHFLIATHSPQIVAQLPSEKCYVTQMETGKSSKSEISSNHSIDFQLARVFQAPGFQNEYLTRLALNTIVRVSKTKIFDKQSLEDYSILNESRPHLRENDPLIDLILSLDEMKAVYE